MKIDAELVESLKEDEAVSVLFSRLGTEYPNLLQALVLERDLFLAWSLKRSKVIYCSSPSLSFPSPLLSLVSSPSILVTGWLNIYTARCSHVPPSLPKFLP